MRRGTTFLSLAIILGLAAALNATPVFAQEVVECNQSEELSGFPLDCDSDFAEGLTITATLESGLPYQYYRVQFENELDGAGAYIPERFNSEAMVIEVLDGVFAFRVQGSGVVVDAQGPVLEKVIANPPIPLGGNPDVDGVDPGNETTIRRTYEPAGEDLTCDVNLPDGREVCLLDPTEFAEGDLFVRLEPGDTVYLPSNSTCFVCNTEQIGANPPVLQIWSSTTGFNGDLEASADQTPATATPSAQGSTTVLAWAFNPGGRCN